MKTSINFIGAPCARKTTYGYRLSGDMKLEQYDVEYIPEHAKTLTWLGRQEELSNQLCVFGIQYQMMLTPKTKYIVCDSPLILSVLYNKSHKNLNRLVLECYKEFHNVNFFLPVLNYVNKGRNEDYNAAIKLEKELLQILQSYGIIYETLTEYSFEKIKKYLIFI